TSRGGVIEYSAGELDIFPGWSLPRRVPEECRGVIGHHHRDSVVAVYRAAQLAYRELCIEQSLRGECAEGDDDLGTDQCDLTDEIRTARRDLVGKRVAVARRPVLQDVRNEHLVALQVNRREDFRQQLARRADEGAAGGVFPGAG